MKISTEKEAIKFSPTRENDDLLAEFFNHIELNDLLRFPDEIEKKKLIIK